MIPIVDLKEQYRQLKAEMDAAVLAVLGSGEFINGPNVRALERELAAYLDVKHAVALNSGTDALHLALRALDIGPGDEVATVPFTFVATTEAIGIVGATPVFVDIDPTTFNMDPDLIEPALTPKTKAIMPVHLYGRPAPMPAIMAIARRHGLAVIEDCAQAIGAQIDGQKAGTFGDIGCFSFYPSKNLGAYGDGGMAVTNSDRLANRLRALGAHGGHTKYYHEELGVNSRLDELQAAILRVKLPYLESWIAARRQVAARYDQALSGLEGVGVPCQAEGCRHVYHQYTVRLRDRDRIRERLTAGGIGTMIYYPAPLHLQPVHSALGKGPGSYPASEAAAAEALSLPMYPELSEPDQARVIEQLCNSVQPAGVR